MNVWVFIGHRRRRLGMCISAIQPQILLPVSGGSRTGYGVGNASFSFSFLSNSTRSPFFVKQLVIFLRDLFHLRT